MLRRFEVWLVLSLILLAGFSFLGIWSGIGDWQDASTRLQLITCLAQITYGLLALIAIPSLLISWKGLKTILRMWLAALAITGGLAPVAWGGASAGVGIAALIITFMVALAIIWVVRRAQVAP